MSEMGDAKALSASLAALQKAETCLGQSRGTRGLANTKLKPGTGHSGVGGLFQPPPGPAAQPCHRDRSVNVCGVARYSSTGRLRVKLLATMYTHPVCESGVGIGS